MAAAAQIILSGIVGAVGQPEADNIRSHRLRNLDAFDHMLDRSLSHLFVEMAQAAETVYIVLKEVRIHGTNTQAELPCILLHCLPIVFPVPGNVNGDAWTDTGDLVAPGPRLPASRADCWLPPASETP